MTYQKQKMFYQAYRFSDLSALLLSIILGVWGSNPQLTGFTFLEFFSIRVSIINLLGFLTLVGIWLLIFDRLKLYQPLKPRTGVITELIAVGRATGIATIIYAAAGQLFQISAFSPLFLAEFWPLVTLLTLAFRRVSQVILRQLNVGDRNQRNILVVGSNEKARKYAEMVEANSHLGYRFIGFLDDEVFGGGDIQVVGKIGDFEALLKRMVVDEVVIAIPMRRYSKGIEHVIDLAAAQGILVRFPMSQLLGDLFGENAWRIRAETMLQPTGIKAPELVMYSGHQVGWRYLSKRLSDLVLAGIAVILLSPLLLLVALLIKVTSDGPALFVQDRYGYNGRVFRLYKFRTMVQDADDMQDALRDQNEMDGAAFKIRNDPRITRIGSWLRKTSIDELPQLLNVVKGDMSLVGPRPLPLKDYQRLKELSHRRRLSVLPGITCTWQAGGRNDISFDEWMRLDMEYIDNWSFLADIKIILKTIPAVLRGSGAA